MIAKKLIWLVAAMSALMAFAANAASGQGRWDHPASALAEQIANILGPGQARLTLRNLSSIPSGEIPNIQSLLEQDLKAHGITASDGEGANTVRITLSENARQRLWVAEVTEGDEKQVAMVEVAAEAPEHAQAAGGLLLRKDTVVTAREPILAALETTSGLVVLEPQQLVIYAHTANGWQEQKRVNTNERIPLPRDPRGLLYESPDGTSFEAWLAGTRCTGSVTSPGMAAGWAVQCNASDDPWTLVPRTFVQPPAQLTSSMPAGGGYPAFKAFYNAARNYFSGVVSPSVDIELPAFYSAALLSRAAGNAALLLAGIDGRTRLAENGVLNAVAGTRDWGSDIGVLHSSCGTGTQIIASGSGEAASDSLRAYELPALEAVPVSAPLAMQGTVTAIWPAPDWKSVYAAVRTAPNQFEVDRVSAFCN
jgi:hypothetical protein